MLLSSLLLTPIIGVITILFNKDNGISLNNIKFIALATSVLNFFISIVVFILFDFSTNQFQFVQEYHDLSYFDFYLGVDGLSIYFILLTTIIMPISLVSNWKSIKNDVVSYVIIMLLLETLLLAVFLVLDILLFYIFFESILPPLFILVGIFGSDNRVKASFYLFLYTLFGSLFLLLSILAMSSIMSATDFDTLFKGNFLYVTQLFLFYGIFIAFAVKTPTIFLNTWLLKAHVESPLGGSIILAAIVLKISLYGILRLILPILPKAYMGYTYIIFLIGVISVVYASISTLRTIDVKELIAYSSVSHAAVYLLAVFSNSLQGIEGAINLGLAHGLVSPGLFICAGGVLYDRSHTRVVSFYRGVTQVMPLFAILFFILCLGNCGAPLSLNFIGEFLSLYGVFERSSLFGVFASSSIVFSAAYTIYMYQRIAFGGSYSRMFTAIMPDLTKREFTILLLLTIPTVFFGIYPAPILDAIHYSVSTLIYSADFYTISCDTLGSWTDECFINNGGFFNYKEMFLSFVLFMAFYGERVWYFLYGKFFNIMGNMILGKFSLLWLKVILGYYIICALCIILPILYNGFYSLIGINKELLENWTNLLYILITYNTELSFMEGETSLIEESPMELKNHIFLSSNKGPNWDPSQSSSNPGLNSNNPGGSSNNPWAGPISNPNLRPSIFDNPHFRLPPTPERVWRFCPGQAFPEFLTKAFPGEQPSSQNMASIREGYFDYCDQTKGPHQWNPQDTSSMEKDNGPCYNCKQKISMQTYHRCLSCYRGICAGCNHDSGLYASKSFAQENAENPMPRPK